LAFSSFFDQSLFRTRFPRLPAVTGFCSPFSLFPFDLFFHQRFVGCRLTPSSAGRIAMSARHRPVCSADTIPISLPNQPPFWITKFLSLRGLFFFFSRETLPEIFDPFSPLSVAPGHALQDKRSFFGPWCGASRSSP